MNNLQEDIQNITNGAKLLSPIDSINIIYHYTDVGGLQGILASNNIWASHAYFMNDKEELFYCYDLIIEILKEYGKSKNAEATLRLYQLLLHRMEDVRKRETEDGSRVNRSKEYRASEFILSFSLNEDSFSLWAQRRGYGYNLGVVYKELNHILNESGYLYIPGKVEYDKNNQTRIIKYVIDEFTQLFVKHQDLSNDELENLVKSFSYKIRLFANFFKRPQFKNDEEFRIVIYNYKDDKYSIPKYRIYGEVFIPYIDAIPEKLNLKNLPLQSICIGPLVPHSFAKEGVSYYLDDLGYDITKVKISSSEVQLRYL